ncbi:hypothetical protein MHYP_G00137080 [Metynnis hypsauchen]
MAVEARPELVGRRFVCASGSESLELGGISRWSWRAGVIRAVSTRETDSPGLAVAMAQRDYSVLISCFEAVDCTAAVARNDSLYA